VPLKGGKVADDTRIGGPCPTIERIIAQAAGSSSCRTSPARRKRVEACPCGPAWRCWPAARAGVQFVEDCIGERVEAAVAKMKDGEVLLLENLRYYAEKKRTTPGSLRTGPPGELYRERRLRTAHRAHASPKASRASSSSPRPATHDEGARLPRQGHRQSGEALHGVLAAPRFSGKIDVITNRSCRKWTGSSSARHGLYLFKSAGLEVGSSLVEADKVDFAGRLLARARTRSSCRSIPGVRHPGCQGAQVGELREVPATQIPSGSMGVDIGPKSVAAFRSHSRRPRP